MPEEEVKLSGYQHLPDVAPRENLITYKRRKFKNKSPKPQESSETSLKKWNIKKKGRDMGWAHGKMINGNRQHWQCNWCGLTRFGGGVTRLKRHLAGDLDVRQCPNAPAEVVKEARCNLIKKLKSKLVRGLTCQENPDSGKKEKERIEADGTKNCEAKKEDLGNKEKLRESWKVVLENMLNMPDGSGSGGVHICIRDALSLLKGPIPCSQVDTGILTKWGRAIVDILSNDKFGLLCTLLCTNFGEGKSNNGCYFDFSQINASMKEGEYDRSPDRFHRDIQKLWEKFERIGGEMVELATSLTGISRAAIEKQVGPAMPERKDSVKSNIPRNSTSSDSNPTLDQDELEPSQNDMHDDKSCMCSYCNLPIGEWEHISCAGCKLTYHLACVNPFTEDDTPNHTWYCPVCVSDKPRKFGTERENLVSNIDANNSPVQMVRTGSLEMCKICRGPKERGEVLMRCGRLACPYKYYQIECLKKHQITNAAQANKRCWYCPSRVCHTCLANENNHLIISCAGCDKAYHIYCVNPSQDSVPNEIWYCDGCDREREREQIREYRGENESNSEIYEPMKMLIRALESLEGQEKIC